MRSTSAPDGDDGRPGEQHLGNRGDGVDVSVVIPTFNRCDRLRTVLEALARQDRHTADGRELVIEVIVVSDGSTDATAETVSAFADRREVTLIEQENAGPAAARNRGVAAATGRIILFIDDDVVPGAGCVSAHIARHDAADDVVVIGPMLTPSDGDLSAWVSWEQHQLDKQYRRFAEGEPAYPRQFYTGNASIRRAVFVDSGGFDTSFRRAEDVELGHRLEELGQSFVFEPRAEAFHYAERSLESWLQVASDYGRHDVAFSERGQPWMREFIADGFRSRNVMQRMIVRHCLSRPRQTAGVRSLVVRSALAADRAGLRTPSRLLLSVAYGLNYYMAVASELGSPRAFEDLLAGRPALADREMCVMFVLEQTLGHITHAKNLRSILPMRRDVRSVFVPVDDSLDGPARWIPGWSNWTVRAGVRAGRSIRRVNRSLTRERPPGPADAMFVHSQVPAVLLGRWMRRIPTVVSLDATPIQYDELGEFYSHAVGWGCIERMKFAANQRCYERARHIVTWSNWAKQGLVERYAVPPAKVTVIAPGVDVEIWAGDRTATRCEGPVRILFVGGDLRRKGGDLLVEACRRLRADPDLPEIELHLVTHAGIPGEPGLVVHHGLTANSPELIEQYLHADIFCLPTLGDCLPMVLAEAGAAGLPLVSTDVGAISELVRDGETGRIVPAGDLDALVEALGALVSSPDERVACGRNARALVGQHHDAVKNAGRLVELLRTTAMSLP